jgi:hypothetical protein
MMPQQQNRPPVAMQFHGLVNPAVFDSHGEVVEL